MTYDIEDVLAHHGVKGMKWGRRKAESSGGSEKISRKQNRQMNKKARQEFYNKKTDTIVKEAVKGGNNVLIKTTFYGDPFPTLVTGKNLTDHLAKGGLFDVKTTEIVGRENAKGEFEANDTPIGTYKKQNFRKKAS